MVSEFPYGTYFKTIYQQVAHANPLQLEHLPADGTEHQANFPLPSFVEND
jgi:hypothetical protein